MRKGTTAALLSGLFIISATATAFAGAWEQAENGWKYRDDSGSYAASEWRWIDGNGDGQAECYYFYSDGYMAHNNEIEGSHVNDDGQWTVAGKVQRKTVGAGAAGTSGISGAASGNSGNSGTAGNAGISAASAANQQFLPIAKQMIENRSWSLVGSPADVFTVVDLNADGIYEVVVEHNGGWSAQEGAVLYWANGTVGRFDYGEVETFGYVDPEHGWFSLERTRGKAIDTIEHFSPATGVTEVDSWFDYYERPEDAGKTERYFANMRMAEFWPATPVELNAHLSGAGVPAVLRPMPD